MLHTNTKSRSHMCTKQKTPCRTHKGDLEETEFLHHRVKGSITEIVWWSQASTTHTQTVHWSESTHYSMNTWGHSWASSIPPWDSVSLRHSTANGSESRPTWTFSFWCCYSVWKRVRSQQLRSVQIWYVKEELTVTKSTWSLLCELTDSLPKEKGTVLRPF